MIQVPNKTIYVSDADLPIFEEAASLAGENLSATIIRALRQFIITEKNKREGVEEITVKVGNAPPYHVKRFKGSLLGKQQILTHNGMRVEKIVVYQTSNHRFAVYTKHGPNWSGWAQTKHQELDEYWPSYAVDTEVRLDVYETVEDLRGHIPDEFYESIVHALQGPGIETLDI